MVAVENLELVNLSGDGENNVVFFFIFFQFPMGTYLLEMNR
jgi:hypothetical protein